MLVDSNKKIEIDKKNNANQDNSSFQNYFFLRLVAK